MVDAVCPGFRHVEFTCNGKDNNDNNGADKLNSYNDIAWKSIKKWSNKNK